VQTVVFQLLVAVLSLVFGIIALTVAQDSSQNQDPHRSTAWYLTGVAFAMAGVIGVGHGSWAAAAFLAGPESTTWAEFIRWTSTGNRSRSFIKFAFAVALGVLALPRVRATPLFRGAAVGLLVLSALLGGGAGYFQRTFSGAQYVDIAVSGVTLTALVAAALVLHAARDTMDRLLWAALCLYAFRVSLGSLLAVANAWFDIPGVAIPDRRVSDVVAILCYIGMLALALRYRTLYGRRVRVPALFEHMRPARVRGFS
jgi:hypothetical protein